MDNLEIIKVGLNTVYNEGLKKVSVDLDKEAKRLLSKLSFSFQIIALSDKILESENMGSNIIEIKMKEFVK